MAYQSIGPIVVPEWWTGSSGAAPSIQSVLLDAANEAAWMVCRVPKTGTVNTIGIRTATVTTGDTYDARLETVDLATGQPSGTLYAAGANANMVIASSDDNVWKESAVLNSGSGTAVTAGDYIAFGLVHPAGTNAANFAALNSFPYEFPYRATFLGGAWALNSNGLCATFKYSDGSYAFLGPNIWPITNIGTTAFTSASTPDERGNRFTPAVNMKVKGAWVYTDNANDFDLVLYDTDGTTPLTSVAVDGTVDIAGANPQMHYFPAEATLVAGSTYRLVVKPGASSVSLREIDVNAAAIMDGFQLGQTFYHTSAKDPSGTGSWTDTTTKRALMGLLISALDDGTGAGGGTTIAGTPMLRGMVG